METGSRLGASNGDSGESMHLRILACIDMLNKAIVPDSHEFIAPISEEHIRRLEYLL